VVTARATIYRTRVAHGRTERVVHRFAYRHAMWLVDLDDLPVLPRGLRGLARFAGRDHLGNPDATIRANVDAFLADHGITLDGGRVLALTNPRSLGYAFNPLSLFWCHGPDGSQRAVVAEVHNTYGERHCYLLRPDAQGRAETAKQFYVSPFFSVDGTYEMQISEPDDELTIAITLRRAPRQDPVFRATLTGWRDPAASRSIVRTALRYCLVSRMVIARIRLQGLLLWLRGVPVVPRSAPPAGSDRAGPTVEAVEAVDAAVGA
jgi:uncharacterized protein